MECAFSSQTYSSIEGHTWPYIAHTQVLASNGRGGGMYVNPLERVSSLHINQPQHQHQSFLTQFILLSSGRPLCLFLHLLLSSSQNPHWRKAQEVAGSRCRAANVSSQNDEGRAVGENPGTSGSWKGEGGERGPLLWQVSILLSCFRGNDRYPEKFFFFANSFSFSETQSISNYTKLAVKRSSF